MKAQVQKLISKAQIIAVHAILNKYGLLEYKHDYIKELTGGRTESAKELTYDEAAQFFTMFNSHSDTTLEYERSKMALKAIWKIAWQMGIIYGQSPEDHEMNKAKLNQFCRERGTVKKNLTAMNSFELHKTHRQFEAMLHKFNKQPVK